MKGTKGTKGTSKEKKQDFLEQLVDNLNETVLEDELGKYIELLVQAENEVKIQEEILEQQRDKYRRLSEQVLPNIMESSGIESIKTKHGSLILKKDLKARVPKDFFARKHAFKWLRENNAGDIIKEKVEISEGINNDLLDKLKELNIQFDKSEIVNTNTLQAFFREVLGLKKGSITSMEIEDIPKEFGLYLYRQVRVRK